MKIHALIYLFYKYLLKDYVPYLEDLTDRTKFLPCEEACFLEDMIDSKQVYNQLGLL